MENYGSETFNDKVVYLNAPSVRVVLLQVLCLTKRSTLNKYIAHFGNCYCYIYLQKRHYRHYIHLVLSKSLLYGLC